MTHLILKNSIRKYNFLKLILPICFLLGVTLVLINYPLINCFFPTKYTEDMSVSELYNSGSDYVDCSIPNLYYTGYDYLKGSTVKGHYYYTLINDKCTIFLLDDEYFQEIPAQLTDISFKARLIKSDENLTQLLTLMAADMNWTLDGITKSTHQIIISEMDYGIVPSIFIAFLLAATLFISIVHILSIIVDIVMPEYSYSFLEYGNRSSRHNMIMHVYEEFDSNILFASDDMFITEHFFICTDPLSLTVLPLEHISWTYKYSRLHKYIFCGEMTYTLKLVTKNHKHHNILFKSKESVDEVLDYLTEHNPEILIGYTTENRTAMLKKDTLPK